MNWKFWAKKEPETRSLHSKGKGNDSKKKLPRPKELPQMIGRHMVAVLNLDPDWVWDLRAVLSPKDDAKDVFMIRIFDPKTALAQGVTVAHYNSLDDHPELILFKGWFHKRSEQFELLSETCQQVA